MTITSTKTALGPLRASDVPTGPQHAPRGSERRCKSWAAEAAMRMLMNNLDPEVAEDPANLVVYGGIGKAARDWPSFQQIIATLTRLEPDETLLVQSGKPVFGICLGHQMLGIALGAKTMKMHQGHHGANHPVKDFTTNKVEIVSMNHGFAVDRDSLPANVVETHVSLFDGSNAGIALKDKPVFSVQHHPEASPGPQDSHYLFKRFVSYMEKAKG
mgnify:CR=1 FL=1